MAKITLQFKDTKSGVDISLDAASFKRIKKSSHKLSPAEELAVRLFVAVRQAEGLMKENELGGPPDGCCGGSCDCEK